MLPVVFVYLAMVGQGDTPIVLENQMVLVEVAHSDRSSGRLSQVSCSQGEESPGYALRCFATWPVVVSTHAW